MNTERSDSSGAGRAGRRWGEPAAYAALAALGLVALFANEWGVLTYDTKPELYLAPGRTLVRELSAWRSGPHLGEPNYHVGFAPVVSVVWVIERLGAEPWVAARLLRAALLAIGAWGMVRHLRQLAPGSTAVARVTAAAVYVANPYAIVSGATLPVLLPYAFLPWLLSAFLASLRTPRCEHAEQRRSGRASSAVAQVRPPSKGAVHSCSAHSSWRGPAGFALALFASGGMNAGVVPLLSLLALPCYVLYERRPLRDVVAPLLRCGVLALGVSAYWLVPSLLATGAGAAVAANTERPDAVAQTSSYAESLRLLGMWTMYGQLDGRLFTPEFAAYLTNGWAVLASFAVPVAAAAAALASRARARLLAVLLLAVSVPVMVGLFPPDAPSPLGRLLALAFDHLPGAIAFRTTNKAGALAAVAVTVLLALGAQRLGRRPWVAGLVALVALGATLPAWTGDLHPSELPIPAYWRAAAADLDTGDPDSRILFLPGQALARYRWGHEAVDDLDASLFERQVVWRSTVPTGSPAAANFLAALDVTLSESALTPGALAAFARYAGVGDVLVRNDTEWERVDGPSPAVVAAAAGALTPLRTYGPIGQHTAAFGAEAVPVPPLARFGVPQPQPVVRAEPAAGALLVDGDNFALPALYAVGLLDGEPAFRLLGDLTAEELTAALDDGGRIVLTDTNRRREWDVQQTSRSFSPTLAADAPLDEARSRTLFGDPDQQTVAVVEGGQATASDFGSPFYPTPFGTPESAFDRDPATAWSVGAFGNAVGQSLTLMLDKPQTIDRVVLRPVRQPGARIAGVRLTVGGRTADHAVPDEAVVALDVPPTVADRVSVEITEVRGAGSNPVGLAEVEVPGVRLETLARLPRTLERLAVDLDPAALAAAPLDVVLTREAGDPRTPDDDEERRLVRSFALPGQRDFDVDGRAAAAPDLPDAVVDQLAGLDPELSPSASSRGPGGLSMRAGKAVDGDPLTAWVPDGDDREPWLDVRFPRGRVDAIELDQRAAAGLVAAVLLDFGDGAPVRADLDGGLDRVTFPARVADHVRVTVVERGGFDAPIGLAEVRVGGAQPRPAPGPLGCASLFDVDGVPVEVALAGTLEQLERGEPLAFQTCGGAGLPLAAGAHRLRAADGWLVDGLRLSSGPPPPASPPAPTVEVVGSSATALDLAVGPAEGPYHLVTGQAYDQRWAATMDGRPLGPPELIDGYATGWRIQDPTPHRFAVIYTPQRTLIATRWLSIATLLACALLLLARAPTAALSTYPQYLRLGRQGSRWLGAVVGLGVVLGWAGVVGGVGLAVWHRVRPPAPRTLLRGAVVLLGLVPLAWLASGLPSTAEVSTAIVTSRLVPHWLAAAGLVLLVVGVARSVQAGDDVVEERLRVDLGEVSGADRDGRGATDQARRAERDRGAAARDGQEVEPHRAGQVVPTEVRHQQ